MSETVDNETIHECSFSRNGAEYLPKKDRKLVTELGRDHHHLPDPRPYDQNACPKKRKLATEVEGDVNLVSVDGFAGVRPA
jgi:hypothetical protein